MCIKSRIEKNRDTVDEEVALGISSRKFLLCHIISLYVIHFCDPMRRQIYSTPYGYHVSF